MKIDPEIEIPDKWKERLKPNPHCPYGSYSIPDCKPSYEEISKQMRINFDILKQEITDHIDKELKRFRQELEKSK